MSMKNPAHPGRILRAELDELGLTVTAFAKHINAARQTVQKIVSCKAGISPEMAIKLEAALGPGAHVWSGMQQAYDLAQAQKRRDEISRGIKRITQP